MAVQVYHTGSKLAATSRLLLVQLVILALLINLLAIGRYQMGERRWDSPRWVAIALARLSFTQVEQQPKLRQQVKQIPFIVLPMPFLMQMSLVIRKKG